MSDRPEAPERAALKLGALGKYSYAWLTLAFFLISAALHWYFGWQDFSEDARTHGEQPEFSPFANQILRETFENWQSEFLQLLWQVLGLAYFLYIGSPSSKENDDRLEAKIDELMRMQAGDEQAQKIIDKIDHDFLRHHGHSKPVGHHKQ
jgi:hypothetical protein